MASYFFPEINDSFQQVDWALDALFKTVLRRKHYRVLLILENVSSSEMSSYFPLPGLENLATIIVSRQLDKNQISSIFEQKTIDLEIKMPSFTPTESRECFASLAGGESQERMSKLEKVIFSLANNYPLAVHVISKLLRKAPKDCLGDLIDFSVGLSVGGIGHEEMTRLIDNEENALAVSTCVSLALRVCEPQQDLLNWAYQISLLAWPTVPKLPPTLKVDKRDFDSELSKLSELEKVGIIVHERNVHHPPCFRMHAPVSQVVQSSVLTHPSDENVKTFFKCMVSFCVNIFDDSRLMQESSTESGLHRNLPRNKRTF